MSFVNATPEYVAAAASDLEKIGTAINYANSMASGATSVVQAAGADAVSASISHLFGVHAAAYQAISAQAALFHNQFVQLMSGGAQQYADTEVVNAEPLAVAPQAVAGAANLSGQAMSSQQFIGAAAQAGGVASGAPVAAAVQPAAAAPAAAAAPTVAPATATVTPMAATTTAAAPAGASATAPHSETSAYAAAAPAAAAAAPAAAAVAPAATAADVAGPATAATAPPDVAAAELSSATMLPAAMPLSNGPAMAPPPASPKGAPPKPSR